MKSSMIYWLICVLILSVAINCTKTMKPKNHQKDSLFSSEKKLEKVLNSTSVNKTEEELGKIGQAKERTTGNHKQKRTEYNTPAARSPVARTEVPNLRNKYNPPARTPSLRTPPVKRVEVPVARSQSEIEGPKKK